MVEKIKALMGKLKGFWLALSKRVKIILIAGVVLVLSLAIGLTVFLNTRKPDPYRVLYPGIDAQESQQVYAELQSLEDMEVEPILNKEGEVLVPQEQWDELLLKLAERGYPKTAPAYNVFLENTSFTKTEFEKKQVLIFQLQDRIQETLQRIEGVESATVTLDIPQESNYVLDNNTRTSSAGIMLNLRKDFTITPLQATAIKNLVSSSVPNMTPESVRIVDARSGVEILAENEIEKGQFDFERLEFEKQIATELENKVTKLLIGKYGADGVRVAATVVLNYDDKRTEENILQPEDDGNGVKKRQEEHYKVDGTTDVGGIVGEQNNTDTPQYAEDNGGLAEGTTEYDKATYWDVSNIKTQTEKKQAVLEQATIAAVVNDPDFTTQTEETLIALISNATNIPQDYITVTNLDYSLPVLEDEDTPVDNPDVEPSNLRTILLIAAGGLLLVLIITVVVILLLRKRAKKKKEAEEAALLAQTQQAQLDAEAARNEIEEHMRSLREAASAPSKEDAVTSEIRNFAKENPEITAALLRSWIKEGE